ncbi:MAG: prolipoprotein diacylglyceryl transferase [Anaerolineae bacterium]|nr:prolipoprotein diacylglyceryl transferase [Anaerolineae bacterium]
MIPPVDPILLNIGPLAIHWYGLTAVAGIMLGGMIAAYLAKRQGHDPEIVWEMLTVAMLAGIIGARIEYVVTPPHWNYFRANPLQILFIWQGGLRIYGAVIAGALSIAVYARVKQLRPLMLLDFGAPGMAFGHAIGRWGNFINQELYGPPTTLPWGLDIPPQKRVGEFADLTAYPASTRFHPAFLYESLANLILFLVLLWASHRLSDRLKAGDILIGYIIGYSIIRYSMDFLRTDGTSAQPLALALIVIGIAALVIRHWPGKQPHPTQA